MCVLHLSSSITLNYTFLVIYSKWLWSTEKMSCLLFTLISYHTFITFKQTQAKFLCPCFPLNWWETENIVFSIQTPTNLYGVQTVDQLTETVCQYCLDINWKVLRFIWADNVSNNGYKSVNFDEALRCGMGDLIPGSFWVCFWFRSEGGFFFLMGDRLSSDDLITRDISKY